MQDTQAQHDTGAAAGAERGRRDVLVQRTFFAGTRSWVNDQLYTREHAGRVSRSRDTLHLGAGARVDTNTYFGRFEASYWQRWTELDSVRVEVAIETESGGEVDVLVRASDIGSHVRTVDFTRHVGSGTATLTVPVTSFYDGGGMWLDLRAVDHDARITSIRWYAATARERRHTAIAICTFNRADDCAATVAALAEDPEIVDLVGTVYLTDQGTDLVETRENYRQATTIFGEKLRYIRQANLGGAGGFSRGLFEATSADSLAAGPVDTLLMDDDVRVEPESVLRLFAFAQLTRSPILVGAQMLYLFNPDYLLVSGERTDLSQLKAGLDSDDWAIRDESVIDNVQERRIDAEYNAWWSCLVPSEVTGDIGLPMPYFFQWDDIEFGIRARQAGYPTATLQGAAVWHADFYWKDADDFGQFFYQRNSLITATIRHGITRKQATARLRRTIGQTIAAMNYGLAITRIRGIEAFLEGPATLDDGGQRALQAIRAERDQYPETKKLPVDAMPAGVTVARREGTPDDNAEDKILGKRAAQALLGRKRPGPVSIPFEDAKWWHVSLFAEAYVTDASQTGVRHRTFDKQRAIAITKELESVLRRLNSEFDEVADTWRAAQPELTGRENWERLYRS